MHRPAAGVCSERAAPAPQGPPSSAAAQPLPHLLDSDHQRGGALVVRCIDGCVAVKQKLEGHQRLCLLVASLVLGPLGGAGQRAGAVLIPRLDVRPAVQQQPHHGQHIFCRPLRRIHGHRGQGRGPCEIFHVHWAPVLEQQRHHVPPAPRRRASQRGAAACVPQLMVLREGVVKH